MKRLVMVIAAMVVLVPATVWAQDTPKAEVFGGFSILRLSDDLFGPDSITPVGWQASVAANINSRFAVVGDIGGAYKDDATTCPSCKFHTFLGGVRVGSRGEKAHVFGHALYGFTKSSATGSASSSDFTMGYGGGVDISANDKISIRVIQFDWLPTKVETGPGTSEWANGIIRFGFGIVFKTGPK